MNTLLYISHEKYYTFSIVSFGRKAKKNLHNVQALGPPRASSLWWEKLCWASFFARRQLGMTQSSIRSGSCLVPPSGTSWWIHRSEWPRFGSNPSGFRRWHRQNRKSRALPSSGSCRFRRRHPGRWSVWPSVRWSAERYIHALPRISEPRWYADRLPGQSHRRHSSRGTHHWDSGPSDFARCANASQRRPATSHPRLASSCRWEPNKR